MVRSPAFTFSVLRTRKISTQPVLLGEIDRGKPMNKVVNMLMLMTYSIMDAGARLDRQTPILIDDTVRFIIFTNKTRAFFRSACGHSRPAMSKLGQMLSVQLDGY